MRIKTQSVVAILLFGGILLVVAVSVLTTGQRVKKASEQEEIANGIVLGLNELSCLVNDYLILAGCGQGHEPGRFLEF